MQLIYQSKMKLANLRIFFYFQAKRIKERHGEESQGALEMMMKLHKLYEKPGDGEKNTYNIDITEEMTKKDVLKEVLEILEEKC